MNVFCCKIPEDRRKNIVSSDVGPAISVEHVLCSGKYEDIRDFKLLNAAFQLNLLISLPLSAFFRALFGRNYLP
jgi:hypothetical protein